MENPESNSPTNAPNRAQQATAAEDASRLKNKSESPVRAFMDFLMLFSGISTASNLARTQGRALLTRGVFLFRRK